MIEAHELRKEFSGNKVLKGLSFSAPKGKITGLVGPNGSGKSTAIRVLTGYLEADSGYVKVNDLPMGLNTTDAKRLIGYAPEHSSLYRELTTKEQLFLITGLRGLKRKKAREEVSRVVTAFSLERILNQVTRTLSKGFQHRVTLAQSLIGDPPVIVLDEPTDGLDPLQKAEARRIIRSMSKDKTILLTTHILEEIDLLCDRVVLLERGVTAFSGPIDEAVGKFARSRKIRLRVVDTSSDELKRLLQDIPDIQELTIEQTGCITTAYLQFYPCYSEDELRDKLSLKIYRSGKRIVELTNESMGIDRFFDHGART